MAAKKKGKSRTRKIAKAKAAELLWDEWKVRHSLFWQSFYRWGAATVTLEALPYLNPSLMEQLGQAIFVFPALALVMATFGALHLYAEYERLRKVTSKYYEVMGSYLPERSQDNVNWKGKSFLELVSSLRMGHIVPILFFAVSFLVTLLNAFLLYSLTRGELLWHAARIHSHFCISLQVFTVWA